MGAGTYTIDGEIQTRYETAFETLAFRCLGEPYNFHRVAQMLLPGMLKADITPARIVSACMAQYSEKASYTPQSVALACGLPKELLLQYAGKDSEMSLPDAMETFLTYYGQWVEVRVSEQTHGYVIRGLSSEEIQSEQAKARREYGLCSRLEQSDGKDGFEAKLAAALEGRIVDYPVKPFLPSLRSVVQHYEPGDYIAVGALTGNGKSYYALNQIKHTAEAGIPCTLINLENSPENMQKRLWQMEAGVLFKEDLRANETQMRHYLDTWQRIKTLPIKGFNPGRTLNAILNTIRQDFYDRGTQFAVIDYAQLISVPGWKGNRNYELGEVSAELRSLALELKIPIMVLAQFKQEVSKTGNKRGGLYDIRDCANFAQDATFMQSLYRPSVFDIDVDDRGVPYPEKYADAFVCKGRETGIALCEARFDPIRGFYPPDDLPTPTQFPTTDFTNHRPQNYEDIPF
jgi:hypothetical protein